MLDLPDEGSQARTREKDGLALCHGYDSLPPGRDAWGGGDVEAGVDKLI